MTTTTKSRSRSAKRSRVGASLDAVREAFRSGAAELVGTWEAAEIIGVERPRIGRWLGTWRTWMYGDKDWQESGGKEGIPPNSQAKPGDVTYGVPEPEPKIPKPIAETKAGPVWLRADIEEFAAERQKQRAAA